MFLKTPESLTLAARTASYRAFNDAVEEAQKRKSRRCVCNDTGKLTIIGMNNRVITAPCHHCYRGEKP